MAVSNLTVRIKVKKNWMFRPLYALGLFLVAALVVKPETAARMVASHGLSFRVDA